MKKTIFILLMLCITSILLGQVPGESCQNPYIATLPLVNFAGDTADYGNNYNNTMIAYPEGVSTPSLSYINGNDFVAKVTLTETSFLSTTVIGTTWTGLFIFDEEPNAESPVPFIAAGGISTSTVSLENITLQAGDYFIIVSTWPTPNTTTFTLNINANAITPEPLPAVLVSPLNEGTAISTMQTLNWTAGHGAEITGYKLYFGTSNPPTTMTDLGNVTTYSPELNFLTTYYWQIVPYNTHGDATNCPVWSFTTQMDETVNVFPWTETFTEVTFPPQHWTRFQGLLTEQSTLTTTTAGWVRTVNFANLANHPNGSGAKVNIYGTTINRWLVTPPINLGQAPGAMQLEFDLALTWWNNSNPPNPAGIDDKFAVVISTDDGVTWSSANTLALWDNDETTDSFVYNNISLTGQRIYIDLSQYTGIVRIGFYGESTISNADNDLHIDNITIREIPENPIFSVTPTEKDFGLALLNSQSNPQAFTVTNNGAGSVNVTSVALTGADADNFNLSGVSNLPVSLTLGQTFVFNAVFAPLSEGLKAAEIEITYDYGRFVETISLSGEGFDGTITNFPYIQNFDDAAGPELPIGWGSFLESTSTSAYVDVTTIGTPHSTPNHLRIANSSDLEATLVAYSPIVENITTKRVKFYAKGTNIPLQVGYITNSSDVSTFTVLETFTLTANYTEYILPLGSSQGDYLAFKHGLGGTSRTIYIDNIIIEELPTGADFLCNVTNLDFGQFMLNQAGVMTVNVSNLGSSELIINQTLPAVITSNPTAPISIPGGENIAITYTMIPTEVGEFTGEIVMTTNATNAPTHTISVTANILPAPPEGIVQIGSGTLLNQNLPWEPYWRYTFSQTIYYPGEINRPSGESITALQYNFNGNSVFTDVIQIYMGYTDNPAFATTASWIPIEELTLVYDGPVTTTAEPGWVEIDLDIPFIYNSSQNLVIAVSENVGGPYHNSNDDFYCQAVPVNRSLVAYKDAEPPYVLTDLPTGNLRAFIPNTRLTFVEAAEGQSVIVNPTEIAFGDVITHEEAPAKNLRIISNGTDAVTITSITISGTNDDQFTLNNVPELPHTLQGGQFLALSITHLPTLTGNLTATINISDNRSRQVTTVPISSNSIDYTISTFPYTQNFDNLTAPAMPVAWHVTNTTPAGYVRTLTTNTPNSTPNQVVMYNASDITNELMFSTPIVSNITEKRIKFYAKKGTGTDVETLIVGSSCNPHDPASFEALSTVTLTSEHQLFIVPLGNASGQRITFKHPMSGTFDYIYIDDIVIENLPTGADFLCTTTELNYGSVMQFSPATHTVNFQNLGSATLTLNITNPTGMTTNMPNPINIPAGQSQAVNFVLTATTVGDYAGTINITTNATNQPTYSIPVTATVLEAPPAGYVQIGAGSEENHALPWEPFYRYTYSQTIYYPHEINIPDGNLITSVSYYFNGFQEIVDSVAIYLGYTNNDVFETTTSWVPFTALTEVFNGEVTSPEGAGWVEIYFTEEFVYNANSNLVIAIHEYKAGPYHSNSSDFHCTAVTGNRSIVNRNDSTLQDPANPPTASFLKQFIPNTRLQFEDDTFPRPRNLTGNAGYNVIELNWEAPNLPEASRNNGLFSANNNSSRNSRTTLSAYKVYKNGQEVMFLSADNTSFTDHEVINGIPYTYFVTAIYESPEGESNPSNMISIAPEGQTLVPPSALNATVNNQNNINLTWFVGNLVLDESFETAELSQTWVNIDADNDERKWEITNINPKEGYQSIMSRSRSVEGTPVTPNNWLISPSFSVTNNTYLNYWVGAESQTNFAESYLILISFNGQAQGNFETVLLNETLTSGGWQRRSINLSEYSGVNVNIAFVHSNSTNQSALKLDGVQVVQPFAGSAKNNNLRNIHNNVKNSDRNLTGFKIYRNGQELTQVSASTYNYTDQALPNGSFEYWVTAIYSQGESSPGNVQVISITSESDNTITPAVTALKGNYPNPFNPETTISFDLAKDSFVNIEIFNIKGQKVKTLISEQYKAGNHNVIWNGIDDNGRNVSSGVYFYKMSTENYNSINKMILMK